MRTARNIQFLVAMTLLPILGSVLSIPQAAGAEPVDDVRILIDISGSMKHNDPQDLRAPALRLLTRLMPKGARAGVWTYGKYVNMLVPLGQVTPAWQDQAERAATKINSVGLFTNIEDAMQRATRDWREVDNSSQRSLIMLTDGFVDIAKDPALNAAARDRIINKILPHLRDVKAKIYTVALSGEADHALLRQLASATDGWAEEADNADKLQRIFLHLFEKATRPDTLPLEGNHVQVDKSIEEVTFLVFRDAKGKPTELVDPHRTRFGKDQAPKQVRWHSDTGYDLITITKPQPGDWRILGPEDPDNRVIVVTNLKLRATQLPNNLSIDDMPYYFVQLTQQGQVIRRKDFLNMVKVSLHQQQQDGQKWEWQLKDDGKGADQAADDGTFSQKLSESMKPGRHELSLLVDGTTFQREQRQIINIYAQPAEATITVEPPGSDHFVLSVIPYAGLIEPDTMAVTAEVGDTQGTTHEVKLARLGPAEWRSELKDFADPAGYTAVFQVTGKHVGGKPISAQLGPFQFSTAGTTVVAKPAAAKPEPAPGDQPKPEASIAAEPKTPPPSNAAMDIPPHETEAKKINWFAVAWQTVLINIVLIGAGFFAYKRWRKSAAPAVAPLEEAEK